MDSFLTKPHTGCSELFEAKASIWELLRQVSILGKLNTLENRLASWVR